MKKKLAIILVVGIGLGIFLYYLFTGQFVFPGRELAKPEPLIIISCPSGYYPYMELFSECSDTKYVKSGFSNCAWYRWDVPGCKYYNPVCYGCRRYKCTNCGQISEQPPICPPGKSWGREKIKCPTDGYCTESAPIGWVSCPSEYCKEGWLDEYRCYGNWVQRKYKLSDCGEIWKKWEDCEAKGMVCVDGKCVSCECTSWEDVGCGVSPCSASEMKQVRDCNPPGCDDEVRCVSRSECVSTPEGVLDLIFKGVLSIYGG